METRYAQTESRPLLDAGIESRAFVRLVMRLDGLVLGTFGFLVMSFLPEKVIIFLPITYCWLALV